jgi:hypothetical protein
VATNPTSANYASVTTRKWAAIGEEEVKPEGISAGQIRFIREFDVADRCCDDKGSVTSDAALPL